MKTPKQQAYQFFFKHAGYSYDPKTQTPQQGRAAAARMLAKAERDARAAGYTFEWTDDPDGCTGCTCGSEDCACSTGEPHETLVCLMMDAEYGTQVVQSLGGICGADRDYRRVVEAELALEQLG